MTDRLFDGSPAEHGFYMPAEWQPHECTWVAWPHNQDTWARNLAAAQQEFALLISTISVDEPVVVLVPNDEQADRLTRLLIEWRPSSSRQIWTTQMVTNDAWVRDYGPTFVVAEDQLLAIDWRYNAWGGKYPPFDDDQRVVQRCLDDMPPLVEKASQYERIARKISPLCIEGGALEIDDNRILMCTKSCAANKNRNADWSLPQIENELKQCLGAKHVIWLTGKDTISGDDTDGHIDQLARFVPGRKIVYCVSDDSDQSQAAALQNSLFELQQANQDFNLGYELIPLPLPKPIFFNQQRLPASYCNFYITNHSVIVPQFNQPSSDEGAISILKDLFPSRTVIGLPSYNLCVGLGSFHCLTQQQPRVPSKAL